MTVRTRGHELHHDPIAQDWTELEAEDANTTGEAA